MIADLVKARTSFDHDTRLALWRGEKVVLPSDTPSKAFGYWTWYRSAIGSASELGLGARRGWKALPAPEKDLSIVFISGGVESTYLDAILPLTIRRMSIDNLPKLSEATTHEGYLAILAVLLGYRVCHLGIEGSKFGTEDYEKDGRLTVEFSKRWVREWNGYASPYQVVSMVHDMTRFQLFNWVVEHRLDAGLKSCFGYTDEKKWCGECFKCWNIFTFYRALGRDPRFRLSTKAWLRYNTELRAYIETGVDKFGTLSDYKELAQCGYSLDQDKEATKWLS